MSGGSGAGAGLRRHEPVMGTMVAIHITDPLPRPRLEDLADDFYRWMREVDQRFSTYREDSEISRLDRGELSRDGCSPHVRTVLDDCARMWRETDGYFDLYATGRLDPSGYVKGWAADVASARLLEAGSANHFINAGGDVRVRGHAAPGEPWRVGLRHPWRRDGLFQLLIGSDMGVATSGTYERGFHVVNPRTGGGATLMRSVTVVGPDLARADAYATAAVAMGEPGLDWLAGLAARGFESAVVTEDGRGYATAGLPLAPAAELESGDVPVEAAR